MVDPKLSEDGASVVIELDERNHVMTKAEAMALACELIEAATGFELASDQRGPMAQWVDHDGDWVLVRFVRVAWQAEEMRRAHGDAMADSYLRSKGR